MTSQDDLIKEEDKESKSNAGFTVIPMSEVSFKTLSNKQTISSRDVHSTKKLQNASHMKSTISLS